MKNSKQTLYKSLKYLFSFFVGIIAFTSLVILIIIGTLVLDIETISFHDFPFGTAFSPLFVTPAYFSLILINFILAGLIFYLVRTFFKNLEKNHIFILKNVINAKKIALILLVLSVIDGLPALYLSRLGADISTSPIDLGYLVGAIIVWALATILEEACEIAAENQLTI